MTREEAIKELDDIWERIQAVELFLITEVPRWVYHELSSAQHKIFIAREFLKKEKGGE